jgi:hypothetical protein
MESAPERVIHRRACTVCGCAGASRLGIAPSGEASGILLAGVEDGEDVDDVRSDAVDENVIGVNDRLARAGDATGTMDIRVVWQAIGGMLDHGFEPVRCGDVACGDIVEDVEEIGGGVVGPDDGERHFGRCRSMILRASAIT